MSCQDLQYNMYITELVINEGVCMADIPTYSIVPTIYFQRFHKSRDRLDAVLRSSCAATWEKREKRGT